MVETTVEEAMEKYGPSEITREDVLEIGDPAYVPENVAIVTGGASGIGRATALVLAGNGLTAVAVDVDEEGLAEVRDRAGELDLPGEVVPVPGDLTDDADMERVVEEAAEQGTVRYLANIAGIQHIAPIPEFPIEKYDQIHAIMQRAPLVLTKLCWPHFENTGDGRGVVGNMCSAHGHIVTKDKVAYNTVKFGLRGLTQSIAAEGGGTIRGYSVSTAYVKTALVAKQLPDSAASRGMTVDEVVRDVMLGPTRANEMMEPYEVGNLFVWGFSRHCSHLNGGDIHHEGGMTLTYE